jgi:type II secretory pathway component PulC
LHIPTSLNQLLLRLPRWRGSAVTPIQRIRMALTAGIVLAAGGLGWASAAALAVWLEVSLSGDPGAAALPQRAADSVRRAQPMSAFEPIFATNVFHARRSGPVAGPAVGGPVRLTLTGTFIFGPLAFAMVIGPDGRTEEVYRTGECIPRTDADRDAPCTSAQGKLVEVERDRIAVMFGGQRAVITMEAQPAPGSAHEVPRPPGEAPAPPGNVSQTRSGNNIEMHLPAAEVEKTFENFAEIVKQALVVPFAKDGATVGFQIQRIQPGSVFQRIGLQNMDVIRGVNGQPITTADQALRLFSLFRNERRVDLELDRGADSLKMSYIIE